MKLRDKIITICFTLCIGAGAVLTFALPKQEVSVHEKRTLAAFPKFTFDKLFSGKWEKEFESYISDHFPAREAFTAMDAYFMLLTGRNGSNGIYKGKEGYLFQVPVKANEEMLRDNLEAINAFTKKTNVKTKMMIIPSSGYEIEDKLPSNHLTYGDKEIINEAYSTIENAEIIDVTDNIKGDNYYYKTDHHWTSEGAYEAYQMWCKSEGIEPSKKEDYTITETGGFYGTSYSKSALWLTEPDKIEVWDNAVDAAVTIDGKEHEGMFYREHLKEIDKYPVFLDGNHPFETIVNKDNPEGKKVLLIKDSYAHSFAPFMAKHCSQIDMVDLRYYFDTVSNLAEKNDYDEVLILYGIHNFCETNDLSILE